MSSISLISKNNPFRNTETRFGKHRNALRFVGTMMEVAKDIWPRKTAQNLCARAEVSQRAAEYWLASKCEMSLEAVQKLIQSDDGYEFLVAFMGDSQALWWRDLKSQKARADIGREIDALRRRQDEMDA